MPLAQYEKLMETKPTSADVENNNQEQETVLDLLPSKLQEKAGKILKLLEGSRNFQWKSSGEIIYQNKMFPFTHINDLLYMATRVTPVKSYDIAGMNEFVLALKEVNAPQSLFSVGFRKFIADKQPQKAETNWISFRRKMR